MKSRGRNPFCDAIITTNRSPLYTISSYISFSYPLTTSPRLDAIITTNRSPPSTLSHHIYPPLTISSRFRWMRLLPQPPTDIRLDRPGRACHLHLPPPKWRRWRGRGRREGFHIIVTSANRVTHTQRHIFRIHSSQACGDGGGVW